MDERERDRSVARERARAAVVSEGVDEQVLFELVRRHAEAQEPRRRVLEVRWGLTGVVVDYARPAAAA